MATLKKYDLSGKEVGTVDVDDAIANFKTSGQLIKDYIVALRNNARQWSASTKDRSEVKHTTKKPHRQKGTGRARQGMLSAPQYKGGGIVFGPRPKFDQHVRINRKERIAAIRHMLAEKMREGQLVVLTGADLDAPKTKTLSEFKKTLGLNKGRTLFIGETKFASAGDEADAPKVAVKNNSHTNLIKSLRNLPKTSFAQASRIGGYDVAVAGNIVVTEEALNELTEWLKPVAKKVA